MEPSAARPYAKPLPEITPASKPYWDAAREHRLVLQRSRKTGRFLFYPRNISPFAVADDLEWVEVSGRGIVYAFTIARRPTATQWADDGPYVIAIIALEEGPHLTSNVVGCPPEAVHVGMPVVVSFQDVTPEVTLPQFTPASAPPPPTVIAGK